MTTRPTVLSHLTVSQRKASPKHHATIWYVLDGTLNGLALLHGRCAVLLCDEGKGAGDCELSSVHITSTLWDSHSSRYLNAHWVVFACLTFSVSPTGALYSVQNLSPSVAELYYYISKVVPINTTESVSE